MAEKCFRRGFDPDEVKWWCHGYEVFFVRGAFFVKCGVLLGKETLYKKKGAVGMLGVLELFLIMRGEDDSWRRKRKKRKARDDSGKRK